MHIDDFIRNTTRVLPEQGRYSYLRLDMNENCDGLPSDFIKSVLSEITPEFLSTYPEPDKFLCKYADFIGVKPENLVCTNGSDMAIRYLLETFGEIGKEVVTVSPSFEMYRVNCNILGYKHVPVMYEEDFTLKVENIINAINENTRIVVLLNPNNPIGNVYSDEEFNSICNKALEVGALVIVDEAYHYFYSKSFLNKALNKPNVVVLRTFSKLMALAALRIGVIVGSPEIIGYIRNIKLTFDVNAVALLFAERLIDNPSIIDDLIAEHAEGKKWLTAELRKLGYNYKDCNGNYILIKPHNEAHDVSNRLRKAKILVHTYGNPLLNDYIRVTTCSKRIMAKFLDTFMEIDK